MKPWSWTSFAAGVAAGAVLLGGVWGGVAIALGAAEAEREDYEACLIAQGFYPGDPAVDLDALLVAAERCSSS